MQCRSRHTRSSDGPISAPSAFSEASMSWRLAVSSGTASSTRKWVSFSSSTGFFQYTRSGWFESEESISTAGCNIVVSLLRQKKRENILINDLYNTCIYIKISCGYFWGACIVAAEVLVEAVAMAVVAVTVADGAATTVEGSGTTETTWRLRGCS